MARASKGDVRSVVSIGASSEVYGRLASFPQAVGRIGVIDRPCDRCGDGSTMASMAKKRLRLAAVSTSTGEASACNPPLADQQQAVAEARGHGEVVDGGDDQPPLFRQPVRQLHDLQLVRQVEVGGDLVEQDDGGLLGDGAGDQHPLALAAGQGVQGAVGELLDLGLAQGLAHDVDVVRSRRLEADHVRVAAHGHQLLDGEGIFDLGVLGDQGDQLGDLPAAVGADGPPADLDLARTRLGHVHQQAQQGGLARAVGGRSGRPSRR